MKGVEERDDIDGEHTGATDWAACADMMGREKERRRGREADAGLIRTGRG